MCNAWNHPAECRCGWGGEGHLGQSGSSNFGRSANLGGASEPSYLSYINPSARCPECNALVFFYQSPYGGRVYFDELGPPWPKHPCTSNVPPSTIRRNILEMTPPQIEYQWQKEGWKPFACMDVRTTDTHNRTYIHGIFPDAGLPRSIAIDFARLMSAFGHPPQDYLFSVNITVERIGNLPNLPVFIRKTEESPRWCEITTVKLNEITLEPEPFYIRAAISEAYREAFMAKFSHD